MNLTFIVVLYNFNWLYYTTVGISQLIYSFKISIYFIKIKLLSQLIKYIMFNEY